MLDEALESPGFWILGVVGSAMVLLGWKISQKMELATLPFWQMLIVIAVIWIASAVFGRE